MMTFPSLPESTKQSFEQRRQEILASAGTEIAAALGKEGEALSPEAEAVKAAITALANEEAETALRQSVAGRIGTAMEPVSRLAGFDWRTDIALLGGFAAKEVIVSTLGTAYSMGEVDAEDSQSLSDRLKGDSNWNRVVAVAALIFIMFYSPCFVTLVCIAKEASWKWAVFSMGFNTIFAFILAVAVYQIGTLLKLG
jgi:ferrous iron transport protein B